MLKREVGSGADKDISVVFGAWLILIGAILGLGITGFYEDSRPIPRITVTVPPPLSDTTHAGRGLRTDNNLGATLNSTTFTGDVVFKGNLGTFATWKTTLPVCGLTTFKQ